MHLHSDIYYQYNPWWESTYQLETFINRPTLLDNLKKAYCNKNIILLTGLRRVGKTTLLKSFIHDLIQNNIEPKHIFYVSMDDYILKNLSLLDIIGEYRQLHRITFETPVHLFLDEITYKSDYQQQLKNLYDKDNVKIVITSSSSSALRDSRAFLTGRTYWMEVSPLDFSEYLLFKKINLKQQDKALVACYFEDYLHFGGMPEFVLSGNRDYLQSVVDDIIYKDIVAFHGLKNGHLLKDFFFLLMERAGKQVSINKIANIVGISVDTARRYLALFEETFLIYLVPRFGKTNETILSTKKLYAADLGIRNLFTGFRDKGALFENAVFQKIKHLNPRYVFEDGLELDFITENKTLIEVKYGREIESKQQMLFDRYPASKKCLIGSINDYINIDDILLN